MAITPGEALSDSTVSASGPRPSVAESAPDDSLWITGAQWQNNTGQPVRSFTTTWTVPAEPGTNSGQVLFVFAGMESQGANSAVLQAVLRWGTPPGSSQGAWAVRSWYLPTSGQPAFSSVVPVSSGDTLTAVITLTGTPGGAFSYTCEFAGIPTTSLAVQNIDELVVCDVALEGFGITAATDYPNVSGSAFTGITIETDPSTPSLNWQPRTVVSTYGQHTVTNQTNPNGEVDIYYNTGQIALGQAKGSPFVSNNRVFFQDKHYQLCSCNLDGSAILHLGHGRIYSPPFVLDDHVFFEGSEFWLYRINTDGRDQHVILNNTTNYTPFVLGNLLFFQGMDNALWMVDLTTNQQTNVGGNKIYSQPFVSGNTIYFRATDDLLCSVNTDGSGQVNGIGGQKTLGTPIVSGDWIYFVATDNQLLKIKTDGSGVVNVGNNKTKSAPCVFGDWIYFQGMDNQLWKITIEGTDQINVGGNGTSATPFATADSVYFMGTDGTLWRVYLLT